MMDFSGFSYVIKNQSVRHRLIIASVLLLLGITSAHYITSTHDELLHHTYRRLYYIPVVLAAFAFGWRGGLSAAVFACLAYTPHAFFMHHHRDPAPTGDKILEMILYVLVGLLTGRLVDREQSSQRALEMALEERTQMEEALIRAGKLSALGQLLAGVAHELRNPLASIRGSAEGIERILNAPPIKIERAQKLLSLQLHELQRLERSISHFLAFSKMRRPEIAPLDVVQVIEHVIELARHHQSEGHFVIDQTLTHTQIWADKDHFIQVLLNLTLNAIQARREGTPFKVQYIYRERTIVDEQLVCVGVADQGIGITEEQRELIFEPFYSTRHAGAGLGLSLSSRLIEAHGGHIELDQRRDMTCLWICLPDRRSPNSPSKSSMIEGPK